MFNFYAPFKDFYIVKCQQKITANFKIVNIKVSTILIYCTSIIGCQCKNHLYFT